MNRIVVILLIAFVVCGCRNSTPVSEPTPGASPSVQRRTLVAVGDSLTEGLGVEPTDTYPAQLERRLQESGLSWKVVNAGVSGETSSGVRSRLDWLMKAEPDAVLLVTGANDGLRGVDPGVTRENLHAIVSELTSRGVKVMLGGMKAPPNLGPEYVERFESIYPEVAEEHNVPLIPFFLEGVAKVPELNQEDGKHPTAEGYGKVVETIGPQVEAWLTGSAE